MKDKLRIGLLLEGWTLPAWEARVIEILRGSEYAEIALLVINQSPSTVKTPLLHRLRTNAPYALYRLYTRLDNKAARTRPDAFERMNADALLAGVPVVQVKPRQTRFSDFIEEPDLERIRAANLDVLVRMGFRLLRGGIQQAARHGIWSYHHGDHRVLRGKPSGFWEVFERMPTTGVMLQALDDRVDNGTVLARSWSSTNQFSVRNSRNKTFWKSVALLPRTLKALHDLGPEAFRAKVREENAGLNFYDHRQYRMPSNGAFLRALPAHAWKVCKGMARQLLYNEEWKILYFFDRDGGMGTEFWRFKTLEPPRTGFWADPFPFVRDGTYYVFFEEWPHDPGTKGHICVIEMTPEGAVSAPRKVLEQEYHLAYPFVFEYEGEIYMLPDSAQNGTVDVYRAESFPDRWVLHKTLLAGLHLVDPTLFAHNGRWWLFGNVKEHQGASYSDELFLYSSDHPFSERWIPHPMNPIVSDARKARPAGQLLSHQGRLYRVSQDCSRGYGYGINFHEILELNESAYTERDCEHVEPLWDRSLHGMHTFNTAQGLTVIDAKYFRRKGL